MSKAAAIAGTLIAATMLPAQAGAEGPGWGARAKRYTAQGFDALIVRPVGFSAVLVGAAYFIPAAILSAPNGMDGIKEARAIFITVPFESVFKRSLGSF